LAKDGKSLKKKWSVSFSELMERGMTIFGN
jgi:hypothetical protein